MTRFSEAFTAVKTEKKVHTVYTGSPVTTCISDFYEITDPGHTEDKTPVSGTLTSVVLRR